MRTLIIILLLISPFLYGKEFQHLDMKSSAVLTEDQKLTLVKRGLDFFAGCMVAINNEAKCNDLAEAYVLNLKKLVN